MKIFENIGPLKIKGFEDLHKDFEKILIYKSFFKDFKQIKLIFLSHMIKDGKCLSQKIH